MYSLVWLSNLLCCLPTRSWSCSHHAWPCSLLWYLLLWRHDFAEVWATLWKTLCFWLWLLGTFVYCSEGQGSLGVEAVDWSDWRIIFVWEVLVGGGELVWDTLLVELHELLWGDALFAMQAGLCSWPFADVVWDLLLWCVSILSTIGPPRSTSAPCPRIDYEEPISIIWHGPIRGLASWPFAFLLRQLVSMSIILQHRVILWPLLASRLASLSVEPRLRVALPPTSSITKPWPFLSWTCWPTAWMRCLSILVKPADLRRSWAPLLALDDVVRFIQNLYVLCTWFWVFKFSDVYRLYFLWSSGLVFVSASVSRVASASVGIVALWEL